MSHTLGELATFVGGRVEGDAACVIESVASLVSAQPGQLSFFTGGKFTDALTGTSASAVVLSDKHAELSPCNSIIVSNPHLAFAQIAAKLNPVAERRGVDADASVAPSAIISDTAYVGPRCVIGEGVEIGEHVIIEAGTVIGPGCRIGAHSLLHANVTLCDNVSLGNNAVIHPGVVIGSDGFGMANDKGRWVKVPQLGRVVIGDDVEIGANTTIDRGALDDTIIGNGVKLDNQIQIAHNVHIGDHTAIAGCVGIAGSTIIGRHCTIGGAVVIVGQPEIVDNVHITAGSIVTRSITESGAYSSGTPLQDNATWHRNYVRFGQLDELAKRLRKIEKQLGSDDN